MIARIVIPLILLIVLADAYIDWRYLRHKRWWKHLLWWLPAIVMLVWTVRLSMAEGFIGSNPDELELYLLLLGLLVVPKAVYSLCAFLGRTFISLKNATVSLLPLQGRKDSAVRKETRKPRRRNYGNLIGLAAALLTIYIVLYGAFVGFYNIEVRHVEIASASLPEAFDGYRIVQFSDAHVGTLRGKRQRLLQEAIDTINAQEADAVVFTGDLQNTQPQDIYPHMEQLSRVKARDGVYTILGNHDYADYTACDPATKVANVRETISLEKQLGWKLLQNANHRIQRPDGSIVIAGMENDGEGPFPQLGSIDKAMEGIKSGDFVVMLEHDPTSWRRKILPQSSAQLTLSGHTHGAQFKLFGWTPASLRYDEWGGLHEQDGRYLFVSVGMGGLVPFRFGLPEEIVVITLKKKK